jgi:hypothetical protein
MMNLFLELTGPLVASTVVIVPEQIASNGITLAQAVDDADYQALIDSKQAHIRDRCERLHVHVRHLHELGPVLRGALGKDRLGTEPSMQMVRDM